MDNHPPNRDPWDPRQQPEDALPSGDDGTGAPPASEPPAPPQPPAPPRPPAPQARYQPPPVQPLTTQTAGGGQRPGPELHVGGVTYVPAGLWWRIGAFLIDGVILMIAHQIMLFLVGHTPPDIDQLLPLLERMMAEVMAGGDFSDGTMAQFAEFQQIAMFEGWLNVFTCAAYFTVFHGMLGATLGKLSLGLTVLRHDGSRLGYGIAFVRYMGYFIVAKLAYTAWLIPFNREQRTLYDMLLGTNVYRARN